MGARSEIADILKYLDTARTNFYNNHRNQSSRITKLQNDLDLLHSNYDCNERERKIPQDQSLYDQPSLQPLIKNADLARFDANPIQFVGDALGVEFEIGSDLRLHLPADVERRLIGRVAIGNEQMRYKKNLIQLLKNMLDQMSRMLVVTGPRNPKHFGFFEELVNVYIPTLGELITRVKLFNQGSGGFSLEDMYDSFEEGQRILRMLSPTVFDEAKLQPMLKKCVDVFYRNRMLNNQQTVTSPVQPPVAATNIPPSYQVTGQERSQIGNQPIRAPLRRLADEEEKKGESVVLQMINDALRDSGVLFGLVSTGVAPIGDFSRQLQEWVDQSQQNKAPVDFLLRLLDDIIELLSRLYRAEQRDSASSTDRKQGQELVQQLLLVVTMIKQKNISSQDAIYIAYYVQDIFATFLVNFANNIIPRTVQN